MDGYCHQIAESTQEKCLYSAFLIHFWISNDDLFSAIFFHIMNNTRDKDDPLLNTPSSKNPFLPLNPSPMTLSFLKYLSPIDTQGSPDVFPISKCSQI